jgi:acetyl/propionyl-CoA carboxylase alpha subunit
MAVHQVPIARRGPIAARIIRACRVQGAVPGELGG